VFREDLLPILTPILKETLFHQDWNIKESGILALAITIGRLGFVCPHDVAPMLQQFVRQWSVNPLFIIYFYLLIQLVLFFYCFHYFLTRKQAFFISKCPLMLPPFTIINIQVTLFN
jgi:hypothetical protein